MTGQILLLFAGIVAILVAADGFTNRIETLGSRLSLSQAVVGSILAAVGTALPETVLPFVAIFLYGGSSAHEIGVGAILGAPFMLSTLAFFLVGLTSIISHQKKKRGFEIDLETYSSRRDLIFFLTMYSAAILLPLVAGKEFSIAISVVLIAGYVLYAYLTFRGESAEIEHSEVMYLWRLSRTSGLIAGEKPHFSLILVQIVSALVVMVIGAHIFVKSLEYVSVAFVMNPLLFALLVAPVVTELPEKFNSVTWTWKGRDTLAVGNITGAMVFQSTFPVSIGLLFTKWHVTGLALFSAIIALTSALLILAEISLRKRISPITLLLGGALYLVYAAVLMMNR